VVIHATEAQLAEDRHAHGLLVTEEDSDPGDDGADEPRADRLQRHRAAVFSG
jgi:hypothetical protein